MNEQETIVDIIAEKRREADYIEETARGSLKAGENYDGIAYTESDLESALDLVESKRKEADRLEAAYKRDKAAIEADALAVGGMVEAARKRGCDDCAKLRDALQKAAESAAEIMERVRYKDGLAFSTANYIAGVAKDALAAEKEGGAA